MDQKTKTRIAATIVNALIEDISGNVANEDSKGKEGWRQLWEDHPEENKLEVMADFNVVVKGVLDEEYPDKESSSEGCGEESGD